MDISKNFHVLSDVHLEFYKTYPGLSSFIKPKINENVNYLCLCGDIGNPRLPFYKLFLQECAASYEKVFIICGNHEYYYEYVDDINLLIQKICDDINPNKLIFLNNSSYDISGTNIRILGTTLWTKIDNKNKSDIKCFIADFRSIKNWSIYKNDIEHHKSLKFIKDSLCDSGTESKRFIIITHHAPLLSCGNIIHRNSILSSAFKNDLMYLISEHTDKISVWMYGHDHYSMCFKIENTLIVSNQLGYPGEIDIKNNNYSVIV